MLDGGRDFFVCWWSIFGLPEVIAERGRFCLDGARLRPLLLMVVLFVMLI